MYRADDGLKTMFGPTYESDKHLLDYINVQTYCSLVAHRFRFHLSGRRGRHQNIFYYGNFPSTRRVYLNTSCLSTDIQNHLQSHLLRHFFVLVYLFFCLTLLTKQNLYHLLFHLLCTNYNLLIHPASLGNYVITVKMYNCPNLITMVTNT